MDGYMSLKCEREQNGHMTQSELMNRCLSALWIDPEIVQKYDNGREQNQVLSLRAKTIFLF
jgi:hypothetical protein